MVRNLTYGIEFIWADSIVANFLIAIFMLIILIYINLSIVKRAISIKSEKQNLRDGVDIYLLAVILFLDFVAILNYIYIFNI